MLRTITIGRDQDCDISLADESVSRRHAELAVCEDGSVVLVDLESQNGTTRVRGEERMQISQAGLRRGDRVLFGDLAVDAEMLLEVAAGADSTSGVAQPAASQSIHSSDVPERVPSGIGTPQKPAKAETAGLAASGQALLQHGFGRLVERGYLLPIFGFGLMSAILLWTFSAGQHLLFSCGLGVAITSAMLVLVYRLAGKRKPWPVFVGICVAEYVLMKVFLGPFIWMFRDLPGIYPLLESQDFLPSFVGHFVGAGLMEELMKMIPVFVLVWITARSRRTDKGYWGVIEPLDAIVYACAAAGVFVILETFDQYVPNTLIKVAEESGVTEGLLVSGQLGTIRALAAISGHMAYSGVFGYFVGMGIMRQESRWHLWLTGWVFASLLHALHNSSVGLIMMAGVAVLKLGCLMSAILAARKISPTRDENFATMFVPKGQLVTDQ